MKAQRRPFEVRKAMPGRRKSQFVSLESTLAAIQSEKGWPQDKIDDFISFTYERYIRDQSTLHFETGERALGPGRLLSFNVKERTVCIQLRADNTALELSFDQINDFGYANYESPETMGETLLGAYWEAKTTRKYLERLVINSYARIALEEIDSFEKITSVSEADVNDMFPLLLLEADVKRALCNIVGTPYLRPDWGGESCDLFCSLRFRRQSVPAAFILKGKSYARKILQISDLGKNGDQVVRMFSMPAKIFVVQSNGAIDGAVYNHIQAQVAEKIMTSQPVYYVVMDGVQTARLLRAYGQI